MTEYYVLRETTEVRYYNDIFYKMQSVFLLFRTNL